MSLPEKRLAVRRSFMKNIDTKFDDELRPEYDLSQLKGGVRGKYAQRYQEGTNFVLLAPDVASGIPEIQTLVWRESKLWQESKL